MSIRGLNDLEVYGGPTVGRRPKTTCAQKDFHNPRRRQVQGSMTRGLKGPGGQH